MSTKRNFIALLIIVLVLVLSGCISTAGEPAAKKRVSLLFGSYLTAGMPEQDVFIELEPGLEQVHRMAVNHGEGYLDAPVYASRVFVPHDPLRFEKNPLGPYPKGDELGFTMREWLSATASGTYTVDGRAAEIDLRFENLRPNAVYTIWCNPISVRVEFRAMAEACGLWDGSENSFLTDDEGRGRFYLTMNPLPETTTDTAWLISLVYHRDGKTYGPVPGDYGLNSHTQLLAFIPTPGDPLWQVIGEDNSVIAER